MKLKRLTAVSLLIAVGVVSSHLVYVPIGMARAFPVQHGINLLTAVFFGPVNGVAVAFVIFLIRNLLGTGSLLAFPGSMIGAFLAGILFKKTKSPAYRKGWIENGIVYTVEGNSGDSCRINQYSVGHYEILGYGVLQY